MTQNAKSTTSEGRTWRQLIDRLKRDGPATAAELATAFGLTAMAVRQHLYELRAQGLVAETSRRGTVGRPAKLWRLTGAADRFFPDGHADLTLDLIAAIKAAFGEAGMARLMAVRSAQQIRSYAARLAGSRTLGGRVRALARIRSEEGYMAQARPDGDGGYLLIENHCPICAAARACSGLCQAELALFQEVLGPEVSVERGDHILAGARRCTYRVSPRVGPGRRSAPPLRSRAGGKP